jgi:hypothetical protein
MRRGAVVIAIALLAGCSSSVPASCDWPPDRGAAFVLPDDIRRAEDMAIRFADAQGYGPGWRETREACETALFAGVSAARGISTAEIAAARRQLDHRGFDWIVNVPMAALYVVFALAVTGRITRRFRDEPLPALLAVVLASVVLALAVVVIGQVWSALVEVLRLSSGHLSYRAIRIPWSHHRPQTIALAVIAGWALGVFQFVRRRT